MTDGYFLRVAGRPFCDHTACQAGRDIADKAGVEFCGYRLLRQARVAMRRLNAVDGFAGVASVHAGPCPSQGDA